MTAAQLDPLTLGLVLAALGMGGTLITLYVFSLVMTLLTRLFPLEGSEGGGGSPHPSPLPEGEGASRSPTSDAQPPTPGPQ